MENARPEEPDNVLERSRVGLAIRGAKCNPGATPFRQSSPLGRRFAAGCRKADGQRWPIDPQLADLVPTTIETRIGPKAARLTPVAIRPIGLSGRRSEPLRNPQIHLQPVR